MRDFGRAGMNKVSGMSPAGGPVKGDGTDPVMEVHSDCRPTELEPSRDKDAGQNVIFTPFLLS